MDDELVRIARQAARRAWSTVKFAQAPTWDRDDLVQVAMLAVWEWAEKHPTWREDGAHGLVATVAQRRIIDWLRANGARRDKAGEWTERPVSLDEKFSSDGDETVSRLELTPDPHAEQALEHVEQTHDLARAFAAYHGPAVNAAAAWLSAHGHTLADIGAHYGVTESRASQRRAAFIAAVRHHWAAAASDTEPEAA